MELNSNNSLNFQLLWQSSNVEDYLNEAIDLTINQLLGFGRECPINPVIRWEVLIDPKDIAKDYEEKYPNNIIFLSKENGGQASST